MRGLYKTYRRGRLARESQHALNGVDLSLEQGVRMGLVGASACGKTTLARCIAGWERPDQGDVLLAADARVQLIPQHAGESLNPWFTASEIVDEPLRIRGVRDPRASAWMERVRLGRDRGGDRAVAFSGGERVRLAIARALAATEGGGPALLIFDESFSSLDRALQEQMLGLLRELQERFPLTYLLIAHDLDLVERFAQEIAVMDAGRIVERLR